MKLYQKALSALSVAAGALSSFSEALGVSARKVKTMPALQVASASPETFDWYLPKCTSRRAYRQLKRIRRIGRFNEEYEAVRRNQKRAKPYTPPFVFGPR